MKMEIHGRGVEVKIYELDEATQVRIKNEEPFYPFSYISAHGHSPRKPKAEYFGLLEGARTLIT